MTDIDWNKYYFIWAVGELAIVSTNPSKPYGNSIRAEFRSGKPERVWTIISRPDMSDDEIEMSKMIHANYFSQLTERAFDIADKSGMAVFGIKGWY